MAQNHHLQGDTIITASHNLSFNCLHSVYSTSFRLKCSNMPTHTKFAVLQQQPVSGNQYVCSKEN